MVKNMPLFSLDCMTGQCGVGDPILQAYPSFHIKRTKTCPRTLLPVQIISFVLILCDWKAYDFLNILGVCSLKTSHTSSSVLTSSSSVRNVPEPKTIDGLLLSGPNDLPDSLVEKRKQRVQNLMKEVYSLHLITFKEDNMTKSKCPRRGHIFAGRQTWQSREVIIIETNISLWAIFHTSGIGAPLWKTTWKLAREIFPELSTVMVKYTKMFWVLLNLFKYLW